MAIRTIVTEGDPILTKVCRPVTEFNERLWQLLDDMHDTLKAADGAGLAAPQVGILKQLALVMVEDGSYLEIINPKIVYKEGMQTGAEGCLSVPGIYGEVTRPMKIKIEALDRFGKPFVREAEGFTARAFCHETDHLSGHLFRELVERYVDPEKE